MVRLPPTMLGASIFIPLLLAVCLYAFAFGGRDERIAGAICILGTVATLLTVSPWVSRYSSVEEGLMLVDLAVLAGFVAVALQSTRFWPLWVAGFQLTTAMGHALKSVEQDMLPHAYGAALQFWGYPILLVLAVGTWRRHRRVRRAKAAKAQGAT
ncbi:hypothetical protein SH584_09600 [Sphingomonas sp. LY29]|uniref:hypothetical protein n=1 Tax=Sphingomonas sp. LY29 TaxID=3095341 RepID=UPI002D794108|nr:hypothetical protein [Sphingomonas sp. LY29]WRP25296.1 hypothetical protein SH584_09600 [Sphingomonas sp. LY29]